MKKMNKKLDKLKLFNNFLMAIRQTRQSALVYEKEGPKLAEIEGIRAFEVLNEGKRH